MHNFSCFLTFPIPENKYFNWCSSTSIFCYFSMFKSFFSHAAKIARRATLAAMSNFSHLQNTVYLRSISSTHIFLQTSTLNKHVPNINSVHAFMLKYVNTFCSYPLFYNLTVTSSKLRPRNCYVPP